MSPVPDLAPLPLAPPAPLEAGALPPPGAYAGELAALRLPAPRGLRDRLARIARAKRWVYLLAGGDAALVGAAVVQAGYFGGAFAWVLDRASGAMVASRGAAGIPGVQARVGDRPGPGARARFDGPGLSIALERRADRYDLRIRAPDLAVDLTLDARGAPLPLTLVAPVPGAGPRITQKTAPLVADGDARVGGRTLSLAGAGGLDHTAGLLARETDWRWAFAAGRHPAGAPLAFNLCEGFGLPAADPGENALFLGHRPARLPAVRFRLDRSDPLAPWQVASADGALALTFRPAGVHREARALLLVSTRFAQVAGTFEGQLPGPSGPLRVAGLPGVVEDHWARW